MKTYVHKDEWDLFTHNRSQAAVGKANSYPAPTILHANCFRNSPDP